jgi:hypothetical protein
MITDNSFLNGLKETTNYTETLNGGIAHKSTLDAVYDMFALGGAYRQRSDADCITLFSKALEEDEVLALKCLFYLRDCRGGQGERRFFRVCYRWLCNTYPEIAKRNLKMVSEYGRWDDLIYLAEGTELEDYAFTIIKEQFKLDLTCKTPSLLGKWMPSENASAHETKRVGNRLRKFLGLTHQEYRKALSTLRKRINIVERLMSENRWEEIEFDKLPSKAGLIYKNAFARRDILAKKYETFIKDKSTKVNASTLYPYDVVSKALAHFYDDDLENVDRIAIEKYWNNLPDYFDGKQSNILCVCDTSGSMTCGNGPATPMNVAIALSMYCAERAGGPFKNHYISFSSKPQLIDIVGADFCDKVQRIYETNLCENTNINAVFDLLKEIALKPTTNVNDLPDTIAIISDMEIDCGTGSYWDDDNKEWTKENAATEMELIRQDWEKVGLKLPKLVYWNVDAKTDVILDSGDYVSFVSGANPVIFEQVVKGITGHELMMDKLGSDRYKNIK